MSSGKKVFVHIGRAKTGTTAIQSVLSNNRSALNERGFCYPGTGPHHGYLPWVLNERLRHVATPAQAETHSKLCAELRSVVEDPGQNIIISSEGLQNVQPSVLREWLGAIDEVRIVIYIREQVEWLASAYGQRVKSGTMPHSFTWFADRTPLDYAAMLSAWADEFGRDRLIVRRYDRSRLVNGDAVDDFLSVLGLEKRGLSKPLADTNPSIGGALLEAMRRIAGLGIPAPTLREAIYSHLLELSRSRPEYRGGMALPLEDVEALRGRYTESNDEVARIYFDGGPLFSLRALPEPDEIDENAVAAAIMDIADGATNADVAERIRALATSSLPVQAAE